MPGAKVIPTPCRTADPGRGRPDQPSRPAAFRLYIRFRFRSHQPAPKATAPATKTAAENKSQKPKDQSSPPARPAGSAAPARIPCAPDPSDPIRWKAPARPRLPAAAAGNQNKKRLIRTSTEPTPFIKSSEASAAETSAALYLQAVNKILDHLFLCDAVNPAKSRQTISSIR